MRRIVAATAALTFALLLGGCAMATESRLDEYRVEAERLSEELAGLVASDGDDIVDSAARSDVGTDPSDPAWWQVSRTIDLGVVTDASADAARTVSESLTSDGWTSERVRETAGGTRIADGFRRDEWYVEVTWVTSEEGKSEPLEIVVVSPTTTRGGA